MCIWGQMNISISVTNQINIITHHVSLHKQIYQSLPLYIIRLNVSSFVILYVFDAGCELNLIAQTVFTVQFNSRPTNMF